MSLQKVILDPSFIRQGTKIVEIGLLLSKPVKYTRHGSKSGARGIAE
jgi:hypothetical protein